jgi:pimeloyl-ACP methyl ester carboxylesterase
MQTALNKSSAGRRKSVGLISDGLILLASALAIIIGLWHLLEATAPLHITADRVGSTPITVFEAVGVQRAPVVVIAHGFAGSQQLMQPFAVSLARNGYIAVTFDFLGHGRNPTAMPGGLAKQDVSSKALIDELGEVVAYARQLQHSDGRLALLGHSMASDIVVRYAETHADVDASIAVSLFSFGITADNPRNLLVIDGSLEPAMLKDEGLRVVGMAKGGVPDTHVTYGDFAKGTARRLSFSQSVEHIGVLYSKDSLAEALDWLNSVFKHEGSGFLDARGPWLGLLFAGLIALARPLSLFLPKVANERVGLGLPIRQFLTVAVLPAVLTPLILWKVPTDFLPLLLGDYITVHFALYGLLTAAGLLMFRRRQEAGPERVVALGMLAIAAAAVSFYAIVVVGFSIDKFVTSFLPQPNRIPLIFAVLGGTLPYFVADEWLVRGPRAPFYAYALTKFCFLLSLVGAVLLNPQRLFFLIIIVPVMVIFFVVYGLFSSWAYKRTNHPMVAALGLSVAFAWSIAVTFPLIAP